MLVAGTLTGEPAGWNMQYNCIHDTYAPAGDSGQKFHNIYLSGAEGGTVERNLFFAASQGENVKLGGPDQTARQTNDVAVRYNTLYDGGEKEPSGCMGRLAQQYLQEYHGGRV